MPHNRHLINDFEIVQPAQLLDKGIPLPGLDGRYVVDEGWCAIITEGGAFKEILQPGTHFLGKYHFWRDVKGIKVSTRINNLLISTTREFSISQPVPVEINLDLSVEYRVSDPRRVAMEVQQPLTALWDRALQAVRGAVVYATIDEIRTQGEGLARITLQRLQGMQLPATLGIEVFNVHVTAIKATDAGSDALARVQLDQYTRVQEWRVDSEIAANSNINMTWLAMYRPEIYQQVLAGNQMIVKEMIDKGLLDPAGVLNQPAPGAPFNLGNLGNMLGMPTPGFSGPGPVATPLGAPTAAPQLPPGDPHARMREEISLLQRQPGATVDNKPGYDEAGIPDGSFDIKIDLPRSSGGQLTLYINCPPGYPQRPPTLDVDVDGEPMPFASATLRQWRGQYLVEIAREAKQYFG